MVPVSSGRSYVKTKAGDGERARRALLEAKLLDTEYKIVDEAQDLYFPLSRKVTKAKLKKILDDIDFETGKREFVSASIGPKTLSDALEGLLPDDLHEYLPRAYDLIGDIAVLEIPDELVDFGRQIGSAFQSLHKNFSTVLGKRGAISGTTRVRQYDLLAGQRKTKTIHTEYGCNIAVDMAKAYFSPRLLEEHNRIADLVVDDETVVDMFTGVGPFALHIARRHRAKVYAIDVNPDAIDLLRESMELNRFIGEIIPILGDAHDYVQSSFDGDVDRVIMNHPAGAFEFVKDACRALRVGGIMHYYDFAGGDDPESSFQKKIEGLVSETGRGVETVQLVRRVRDSAPYEYQMVADLVIR
ncbi:MAG: class I SAM-dependent methyltransferase family protein [Candidatus Thorarchaeota archaeon]